MGSQSITMYAVSDADAACLSVISSVCEDCVSVPCFNHHVKSIIGTLMEDFKARTPVRRRKKGPDGVQLEEGSDAQAVHANDDSVPECNCSTRHSHSWGDSGCGCANDVHARVLQSRIHAAAYGQTSVQGFVDVLNQLPDHFAGRHERCTFHARMMCDGPCRCPTRECGCEECEDGEERDCFGVPIEPSCGFGVMWRSGTTPVTCPYHLYLIKQVVAKLVADAPRLFVDGKGKL